MIEMFNYLINILGLNLNIFNFQNIVLLAIALFWLIFASVQDFKRREVENWWSFSLIVIVLAFRAFFSLQEKSWSFFIWGLIGIVVGFALSEIFYYSRIFAGGDAKLLMALGPILMLSGDWRVNLFIVIGFIVLFLLSGGLYGLIYTKFLVIFNFRAFRKEFSKQFSKNKKIAYILEVISILLFFICYSFGFYVGEVLCLILFVSPILFLYAKAVEESCMNKFVDVSLLTIGDWLINNVKVRINGKIKIIKPNWEGLSEKELNFIQKNYKRKVLIRNGIPFVPAFLFAIILLIILMYLLI
jgi:Flp pilus assembly protein protease CpaA